MDNNLTSNELQCIARHIKHYTEAVMHENKNAPDACEGCSASCSYQGKPGTILDPWPAFFKLSKITGIPISVHRGTPCKEDSGHTRP